MSEPIVPRFLSDLSEEEKRHVLEKRKGQVGVCHGTSYIYSHVEEIISMSVHWF